MKILYETSFLVYIIDNAKQRYLIALSNYMEMITKIERVVFTMHFRVETVSQEDSSPVFRLARSLQGYPCEYDVFRGVRVFRQFP